MGIDERRRASRTCAHRDLSRAGLFVRDIAAQGTVVVANSPTLFASAVGTVTFVVKAGDAVAEGQVLATVDSPSLRSEHAREKATLDGLIVSLDRATIEARRRMSGKQTGCGSRDDTDSRDAARARTCSKPHGTTA